MMPAEALVYDAALCSRRARAHTHTHTHAHTRTHTHRHAHMHGHVCNFHPRCHLDWADGVDLRVPEQCPEEIAQLVDDCMQDDAIHRPTAKDIVARLSCVQSVSSSAIDQVPASVLAEVARKQQADN